MIRGYLTRRSNGLYLLTHGKPVLANVGDTQQADAYANPGDGIAFNGMCPWAVKAIWGVELASLETVRVTLSGSVE